VNSGRGLVYVVDQFTGETRMCRYDGCKKLKDWAPIEPASYTPPQLPPPTPKRTFNLPPGVDPQTLEVTDLDLMRRLEAGE
jgi:hypothetical protein